LNEGGYSDIAQEAGTAGKMLFLMMLTHGYIQTGIWARAAISAWKLNLQLDWRYRAYGVAVKGLFFIPIQMLRDTYTRALLNWINNYENCPERRAEREAEEAAVYEEEAAAEEEEVPSEEEAPEEEESVEKVEEAKVRRVVGIFVMRGFANNVTMQQRHWFKEFQNMYYDQRYNMRLVEQGFSLLLGMFKREGDRKCIKYIQGSHSIFMKGELGIRVKVAEQQKMQNKLEYERTIANLKVEKRNLRGELNGLRLEHEDTLVQLEEALGGASALEVLSSGMARQDKMVSDLSTRLVKAESDDELCIKEIRALKETNATLSARNIKLEERDHMLDVEMVNAEALIRKEMKARIHDAKSETKELKKINVVLEDEVSRLNKNLTTLEMSTVDAIELRDANKELDECYKRNEEMERKLQDGLLLHLNRRKREVGFMVRVRFRVKVRSGLGIVFIPIRPRIGGLTLTVKLNPKTLDRLSLNQRRSYSICV